MIYQTRLVNNITTVKITLKILHPTFNLQYIIVHYCTLLSAFIRTLEVSRQLERIVYRKQKLQCIQVPTEVVQKLNQSIKIALSFLHEIFSAITLTLNDNFILKKPFMQ